MLTQEDLRTYHTGFELFDPFGKGRMRELVYDYRLRLVKDSEEIEMWKYRFVEQARSIDLLVKLKTEPNNTLKAENEKLKEDLKYAELTIDSLTAWANRLEQLLNENHIYLPGTPNSTNNTTKEEIA